MEPKHGVELANFPEDLTTGEAADVLGVTRRRVQKLCEEGRLGRKVGRDYMISRDELMRFKRRKRNPGRPKGS